MAASKEYGRDAFLEVFRDVQKELLEELPKEFEMPELVINWIRALSDENVPGGKLNRGLTVVHTLQLLAPEISAETLKKAAVLGWCVEWLQAFFLVADDIMDQSITRRGETCWYRKDAPAYPGQKIGNIAINDSFILESHVFRLLKKYFRTESYYADLLDLFHEVIYQTELGQLLDLTSQPASTVDLSLFTLDTYWLIVRYKTAFYSFYLPFALGLYLAGSATQSHLDQAKSILIPMGEFFQVQDDYLDCYGDPKVIGKIGRDIEEKKCGWLVCTALKTATEEQKKIISDFYGKDDPECVKVIKALYKDMELAKKFFEFEELSYRDLVGKIEKIENAALQEALKKTLAKIYKRSL